MIVEENKELYDELVNKIDNVISDKETKELLYQILETVVQVNYLSYYQGKENLSIQKSQHLVLKAMAEPLLLVFWRMRI